MTKFFLSKILLSLIILISLSTPLLANASSAPAQPQASSCLDDLNWYQSVIGGLGNLFLWVPQKISDIVLAISSYSISEVLKYPITNDQGDNAAAAKAFKSAWKATRNLGNMLIVLGFSIVGIATALRIREYEAKKALFPLIIVAILINFSGVICGVIIDAANLTMNGLSSGGALGEFGKSFTADLKGAITETGCESLIANDFGTFILNNISFGIVYIVVAMAFLFLSFVIIVRMAMLGILYILSPLALACFAFPMPNAKKLFNEWWDQFLNWAMQGVSLTFFIYIAASVSKELLGGTKIDGSDGTTAKLIVVLMVLITGLIFAIKSNPAAAGLAKAAVSFAGGAMVGAVAGSAKIADRLIGNKASGALQKLSSGYGMAKEYLGLQAIGKQGGINASRMKEVGERVGNMSEDQKTSFYKNKRGSVAERSAIVLDKVKNGNIHDLGTTEEQRQAVAGAEAHFKSMGITSNIEGKGGIKSLALKSNPNIGTDEELKSTIKGMTVKQFNASVKPKSMSPRVLGAMSNNQITGYINGGSDEMRETMNNMVNTDKGKDKLLAQYNFHQSASQWDDSDKLATNTQSARVILNGQSSTKTSTPTPAPTPKPKVNQDYVGF